ncbi:ABC transporter ATP-binding protein [Erysipelothrix larvae]|uniref:ABC transporter ATP-binding protein n=1 Tax=Erysipelothrix larvae TaxID=1514105 RepID=A0A0X8GZH5_9FIRM|nr:ABC transporter ATP-binding protein [Erysipelothrix larvae]AMC93276.1 ABC transporter ATP-binding protein [Erysipelothrix larvae]
MSDEILKMEGITKVYPNGVVANQDVNFSAHRGEIHALMGENGAGKSTLMKILFGMESHEAGQIYLNNQPVNIDSPLKAIELGIGMVHQHFMLVDHLSVLENIVLGMEPRKGIRIDWDKARSIVEEASKKYNFNIKPDQLIVDLNVSQKQKVEILKVLIRGANVLIMDEPTAVLTPQETEELFAQLIELKKSGHTILFISHKLKEIKEICDRITIMRSGKEVGVYHVKDVTTSDISRLMIGRDVINAINKPEAKRGYTTLDVKNLKVVSIDQKIVVNDVSFCVKKGEILGIAAIEGNGQRELIDAITGLGGYDSGDIYIENKECANNNPTLDRRKRGLVHIPEDRFTFGVMADESIRDNLISNRYNLKEYNSGLSLNMKKINALTSDLIKEFEIKTDSPLSPVRMLSGGNIQKVVAAREMSVDMSILVADQPTRGIDVGTASFIHNSIVKLRDSGVAVLLSSADINEVLELSDSLIVMYNGEITGYFKNAQNVSEEELGLYMLGLKVMKKEEIEGEMYG